MSMYPRTSYEMTEEDLRVILDACKPTPVMLIGGRSGPSPQENANAAWRRLGEKMGFDHMTVRPDGRGNRFFTAVPSETPEQRAARVAREEEAKQLAEVARLEAEIEERQAKLADARAALAKAVRS